jgi:hypothetical protein
MMGYSRNSFYRFKNDKGGELALQEISRKKPVLKKLVQQEIEEAISRSPLSSRAFGQLRVANELRKRGITVFGAPTWSATIRCSRARRAMVRRKLSLRRYKARRAASRCWSR